uniref:Cleavage and polyadenylation specificity factor subunit 3 n=1 Tax=Auxenochlorella protothecoides TaxID=3075 RepID=A0A1D1ZMB8_AUXPR
MTVAAGPSEAVPAPPADAAPTTPTSHVEIIPLGAAQEVGRSCVIVRFAGKTVMLDCGVHPGFSGLASLPFFDVIDMSSVDVMLVTHFHLDHSAAVPYVVGHTNFRGTILMTHATKAITSTLLRDFVKVSKGGADAGLYTEADLDASLERTHVINFQQTLCVNGIGITAYRAGHVLGAAMFMVEIAGQRILYTGDYSRVPDRHMPAADTPSPPPHIVIVESTYGVSRHLPRAERESRFLQRIHTAVARGGRVLLPVVALGRAQELLLILEEHWAAHPELHGVPIYQASGLAKRAISVYQTYIEMMNADIQAAFAVANPFAFRHVTHLRSARAFDDVGACVVMATPSMLQSGVSRDLFEAWCGDARNLVVIADFAVQGTLAREILAGPAEVLTRAGARVPLRCQVDAISFSAHADFPQTSGFLDTLAPPHVVLVHGEAGEMARLARALESAAAAAGRPRAVYTPRATQAVLVAATPARPALLRGGAAAAGAKPGAALAGVYVAAPGAGGVAAPPPPPLILEPEDLPRYTRLHTGRVTLRQTLALHAPFDQVRLALELLFEGVHGAGDLALVSSDQGATANDREGAPVAPQILRVGEAVTVSYDPASAPGRLTLEWQGGPGADAVADAVVAVVLGAGPAPPPRLSRLDAARAEALRGGDGEALARVEAELVEALLSAQFGPAATDPETGLTFLEVDGAHVLVDCKSRGVRCADAGLKARVERAITRLEAAMRACPLEG